MSTTKTAYRSEIDVLRAIAVMSVVINHYFPSLIRGGFLGVDIFFVISGYLITLQIISELDSHIFSFTHFYKRRIKRIIPALYLMLSVTTALSLFLLLPEDLLRYADSLKSTVLYYSNYYFAGHYDYFAQNTKEFPLLHTWSLSVEEQFYFLLPPMLFILFKFFKSTHYRFWGLAFAALASLIAAHFFSSFEVHKTYSYYSLETRFFELALGSCAAFFSTKFTNTRADSFFRKLLPLFYFVVCIYFFLYSEKVIHPGLALLPLLISTAFILVTPADAAFSTYIKKIKPAVWLGKVSYSFYLWHWPLLALYTYALYRPEYRHLDKSLLLAGSLGLAAFSYYFIENPLRHSNLSFIKSFIFYLLLPGLILLGAVQLIQSTSGKIIKRPQKNFMSDNLFLGPEFCYNKIVNNCLIGDNSKKPKALLFGDSHAGHYIAIVDEIGKKYGFSVTGISISNCYPLFNTDSNLASDNKKQTVPLCYNTINKLSRELSEYTTVILAGRWSSLFDKEYQDMFPFIEQLRKTLTHLQKENKKVILLQQVPEFTETSFNNSVRRSRIFNTEVIFERSYAEKIGNDQLKDILKAHPEFSLYEYSEDPSLKLSSLPFYKNDFIYSDWNHLRESGGRKLAADLGPMFAERYLNFLK